MKQYYSKILIHILLVSAAFSQKIPDWYLKGKLDGYSPKKYFVGIGEGKNYQKALENAGVYIASQMQISISASMESSISESSINGEISSSEFAKEDIKTQVTQSLPSLEVIKNEKIKGTVYVFAVLNRDRYLRNMNFELADLSLSVNTFLSKARDFSRKGNVSRSFEDYKIVKNLLSKLNTKKTFYNSLSNQNYPVDPLLNLAVIEKEIDNLISDLKIEVLSGENQTGTNGMLLPEPIVVRLFSEKYNNPIIGAEILVKHSDGSLANRGQTDSNGKYEFFIFAYDGESGNKVEVALSPKGLVNSSKVKKAQIKTHISYNLQEKPPVSFAIRVTDESNRLSFEQLEKKLSRYIIKLGNEVSRNSGLVILGKVYEGDSKEIDGKSGVQHLVTAELDLSLYSKSSKKAFNSVSFKGKGLSKKNKRDALMKASNKIKINQRKIASLISGAEEQIAKENNELSQALLKEGLTFMKQGRYKRAIWSLANVSFGEKNIQKANETIKEIQTILDDQQKKEEEKREKLRKELLEKEIELAKQARLEKSSD